MAADVVDAARRAVRGDVGELAIRQPWPGMTRGFWAEPDDERYLETYWRRIPGLWLHGDWAAIDADGYWYIHGRSDDTLKVAGKRVGPAEVEACAVAHPAVMEAAAIGVPDDAQGRGDRRPVRAPAGRRLGCRDRRGGQPAGRRRARQAGPAQSRRRGVRTCPAPGAARSCAGSRGRPSSGIDPGDLSALENPGALAAIEASGRR